MTVKKRLIISLDGGGVRGGITASFLACVEREFFGGTSIGFKASAIGGSSAGAINASLAACGVSMDMISNKLFTHDVLKKMFTHTFYSRLPLIGKFCQQYKGESKLKVLENLFGDHRTFNDAHCKLMVATYNWTRQSFCLFHNFHAVGNPQVNLANVVHASSSPPYYFSGVTVDIPYEYDPMQPLNVEKINELMTFASLHQTCKCYASASSINSMKNHVDTEDEFVLLPGEIPDSGNLEEMEHEYHYRPFSAPKNQSRKHKKLTIPCLPTVFDNFHLKRKKRKKRVLFKKRKSRRVNPSPPRDNDDFNYMRKISGVYYSKSGDFHCDGGLACNTPDITLYGMCKKTWPDDEIFLLSVGTGHSYEEDEKHKPFSSNVLGLIKSDFINTMLSAPNELNSVDCTLFIDPSHYLRVEQPLPKGFDVSIDNISQEHMEELKVIGKKWFTLFKPQLESFLVHFI